MHSGRKVHTLILTGDGKVRRALATAALAGAAHRVAETAVVATAAMLEVDIKVGAAGSTAAVEVAPTMLPEHIAGITAGAEVGAHLPTNPAPQPAPQKPSGDRTERGACKAAEPLCALGTTVTAGTVLAHTALVVALAAIVRVRLEAVGTTAGTDPVKTTLETPPVETTAREAVARGV